MALGQTRRLVERSGHDRGSAAVIRFPEQKRSAGPAKTAPGCVRCGIPAQIVGTGYRKPIVGARCCGNEMAGLPAALFTMAIGDLAHWPFHRISHSAAVAAACPLFHAGLPKTKRGRSWTAPARMSGRCATRYCRKPQALTASLFSPFERPCLRFSAIRKASSSAWSALRRGSQCVW